MSPKDLRSLHIREIVRLWNETAEPWGTRFPFIYQAGSDQLAYDAKHAFDKYVYVHGILAFAGAVSNGQYNPCEPYVLIDEEAAAIYSFADTEKFLRVVCDEQSLLQRFNNAQASKGRRLQLYTDGSHLDKQHGGRLGEGSVLVEEKKNVLAFRGEEITPSFIKEHFGQDAQPSKPTAELLAVLNGLRMARDLILPSDRLTVIADYVGVSKWLNGEWEAKSAEIRKTLEEINDEIKKQNLAGRISFKWIPGHQKEDNPDARYNALTDRLARGEKIQVE